MPHFNLEPYLSFNAFAFIALMSWAALAAWGGDRRDDNR